MIVVSSLLLTIPVDSLIASSTWRRLYNRYLKLTKSKHHCPSEVASNSSTRPAGKPSAAIAESKSVGEARPEEEERVSETTRGPSTGALSTGGSSISTANEYGEGPTGTQAIPIQRKDSGRDLVETLVSEQAKAAACSPCSPPATTLSRLDALMNESAGAGTALKRTFTGESTSTSNSDSPFRDRASESDRGSFTSTSTGMTGGASSTTGSGVAGNRMLSRDEMNAIIRANSFDSSKSKKRLQQHEEDAHQDASELENGLNNSWLSNTSLSYDGSRELRGLRSASHAPVHAPTSVMSGRFVPFVFWLLCAGTCMGVEYWMLIAATVGTLATTVLLFIFPTMFYFRMSLPSDFGATPLFARVVPNALYMGLIQTLGVLLLLCDVCLLLYVAVTGDYLVQSDSSSN